MGRPLGMPKTGVFALMDLVGIDLMPQVDASPRGDPADDDPYQGLRRPFPLIWRDDRRGLHRPEGQGRLLPPEQGRRQAGQGSHRPPDRRLRAGRQGFPSKASPPPARRRQGPGRARRQGRPVRLGRALPDPRLCRLAGAGDRRRHPLDVDRAMRLGYNWKFGSLRADRQAGRRRFRRAPEGRGPAGAGAAQDRRRPPAGFYRVEDGRACSTSPTAATPTSSAARACCCSPTSSCAASRWPRTARPASGTSATAWSAWRSTPSSTPSTRTSSIIGKAICRSCPRTTRRW